MPLLRRCDWHAERQCERPKWPMVRDVPQFCYMLTSAFPCLLRFRCVSVWHHTDSRYGWDFEMFDASNVPPKLVPAPTAVEQRLTGYLGFEEMQRKIKEWNRRFPVIQCRLSLSPYEGRYGRWKIVEGMWSLKYWFRRKTFNFQDMIN